MLITHITAEKITKTGVDKNSKILNNQITFIDNY